ncbi:methionyl-tRNA formyltransferase [Candidatus Latescibacterota bacterium]
MGTTEFGIPTLRALSEHHDVPAVVTRPDSTKGRGRRCMPSSIKVAAEELGIEVIEAGNLKDPAFIQRLSALKADLFYVTAFRILPTEVFSIPPDGTINLHASLLPDYRGAAPINHAIINGDTETGLTTFYIEKTIDTGDVILNKPVSIGPNETAGELAARLMVAGAELSLKTVALVERGDAYGLKQPAAGCRPAPKLHKGDGLIDWTRDARSIHNQVRGMNPAPGAFTSWKNGPLKIHCTRLVEESTGVEPGRIMVASPREGLTISCGKGQLSILELQPPGKKVMDSPSFVRGYRVESGSVLPVLTQGDAQ